MVPEQYGPPGFPQKWLASPCSQLGAVGEMGPAPQGRVAGGSAGEEAAGGAGLQGAPSTRARLPAVGTPPPLRTPILQPQHSVLPSPGPRRPPLPSPWYRKGENRGTILNHSVSKHPTPTNTSSHLLHSALSVGIPSGRRTFRRGGRWRCGPYHWSSFPVAEIQAPEEAFGPPSPPPPPFFLIG